MPCKDKCEPFEYALKGPQVEPAAGYWNYCARLCIVGVDELRALTDKKNDPHYFPPYPTDERTLHEEIDELVDLAQHRDDPCHLVDPKKCDEPPAVCEFHKGLPKARCRRPISKLWNLCPYPLGAVLVNRFPGEQVIRTGRGLARAIENETPGLYHRHIADFLMRTRNWSPPRQALVWAALDIAIASALQAAWYYKWLAEGREQGECTGWRERPIEYVLRTGYRKDEFSVLFDCPDELNPAYNLCPDARKVCRDPDTKNAPVSPGTPRHPAYPSGHSTYSAAASEILSFFFGEEEVPPFLCPHPRLKSYAGGKLKTEFDNLADNIGVGRMWAGVHWRSDHTAGQKLGRTVACLVLEQLANMGSVKKGKVVPFELCPPEPTMPCDQCDPKQKLEPCDESAMPPKRSQLCDDAQLIADHCGKNDFEPGDPCKAPPKPKGCEEDHWSTRIDAYRGPQQGGR